MMKKKERKKERKKEKDEKNDPEKNINGNRHEFNICAEWVFAFPAQDEAINGILDR